MTSTRALISPEELELCLDVLQRAHFLPGDDPNVVALERASAGLRKLARNKRRKARKERLKAQDRATLEQAMIHQTPAPTHEEPQVQDRILLETALLHQENPAPAHEEPRELQIPVHCYVCKQNYTTVDPFYHRLCPSCAPHNRQKRHERADLTGRRALVTGGRIKIGYLTALKLLRDGAEVIVTTRFPRDAARRFHAEPDADTWRHRLTVQQVDLRDIKAILGLCHNLKQGPPLNILIHNAAQTIRRPFAYYKTLAEGETTPLPALAENLLAPLSSTTSSSGLLGDFLQESLAAQPDALFPAGALDAEGKQLDLRNRNTWRMNLHEVEPAEMAEVWLVNAFAPTVLNSQLRALLERSPFPDRYIVNVSAVEGQFAYKNKTSHHPHTNMAKAALNMMTRTSGQDYARSGIYMTSVDTGWITDENAEPTRQRLRAKGFRPPLDILDGAARVYDPIVQGVRDQHYIHSVFLKDYKVTPW